MLPPPGDPPPQERYGRRRGQTGSASTGASLLSGAPTRVRHRHSDPLQIYSQDIQPHSTPQQRHRTHAFSGLHFQWSLPYTVVCVHAPSVQNGRTITRKSCSPAYQVIATFSFGEDFNCIAGQQDMLDPASPPGQRTLGNWTGLRHVETEHCLYDVWRDLNTDRRAHTHVATSGQSVARLDRWLISQLRARVSKEPQATGHLIGYPSDHLGVTFSITAPATTLYGAAVWCPPLHLLEDWL